MEKYLLSLIRLLLTVLSPEIREAIVSFLNELEKQADKTVNEWDDLIVVMLKRLLFGDNKTNSF